MYTLYLKFDAYSTHEKLIISSAGLDVDSIWILDVFFFWIPRYGTQFDLIFFQKKRKTLILDELWYVAEIMALFTLMSCFFVSLYPLYNIGFIMTSISIFVLLMLIWQIFKMFFVLKIT